MRYPDIRNMTLPILPIVVLSVYFSSINEVIKSVISCFSEQHLTSFQIKAIIKFQRLIGNGAALDQGTFKEPYIKTIVHENQEGSTSVLHVSLLEVSYLNPGYLPFEILKAICCV